MELMLDKLDVLWVLALCVMILLTELLLLEFVLLVLEVVPLLWWLFDNALLCWVSCLVAGRPRLVVKP